jgi:hypothetical protein
VVSIRFVDVAVVDGVHATDSTRKEEARYTVQTLVLVGVNIDTVVDVRVLFTISIGVFIESRQATETFVLKRTIGRAVHHGVHCALFIMTHIVSLDAVNA